MLDKILTVHVKR